MPCCPSEELLQWICFLLRCNNNINVNGQNPASYSAWFL